jgi:hypothetical protein
MRNMGRATGVFARTGSGTTAQTSGCGVGAFAALGKALFGKLRGIGQLTDALAGVAFAAEIVGEALAICGLREHAGQREFSYAARTSEEQRVGDPLTFQRAAQSLHDAGVAEKFVEAHRLAASFCRGLVRDDRFDDR